MGFMVFTAGFTNKASPIKSEEKEPSSFTFVFKVKRTVLYFFPSPITTALLMPGKNFFKLSSMGTGAMYSPPDLFSFIYIFVSYLFQEL